MKKWGKTLLTLSLLFLLGSILWVVLLPAIVVAVIRSRTGFAVQVDKLSVNPFSANVAIKGLIMKNPEGWPVAQFVELREFRTDVSLLSLLTDRYEADEMFVDVAQVTLVRDHRGTLNAFAFMDAYHGKDANGASPPATKQGFLIRHLVLKFDKLVYADHSGSQPSVTEYDVAVQRDMRNVDSVTKIVSPFTGSVLSLLSNTIGGMFKTTQPDLLKQMTSPLQDAGKKTGEKLKGLLDSLDKRRP